MRAIHCLINPTRLAAADLRFRRCDDGYGTGRQNVMFSKQSGFTFETNRFWMADVDARA